MKTRKIYICQVCGKESLDPDDILLCEAQHMGLTSLEEYQEWSELQKAAEQAGYRRGIISNPETRQAFDKACKALADFETAHNMNTDLKPRSMSAIEILNRWAAYSKFDPNQTRFNLMSDEYTYHRCNEQLVKFMEYDPSGALGVIYARGTFEKALADKRVKVIDIVKHPDAINDELEMWRIFNSPDIELVQQELLNGINKLVLQITGSKMLGKRDLDAERKALLSSVDAVVEQLQKCRVDLFLKGGKIKPIKKFSTHIHVFERLADCLLALEATSDGMYLCYINNHGTADGYFGFFIKSNGNILAINERIDEAYPGQHKNSRNGRWSEDKKFDLFPYAHIFQFAEHDYKGYASKHMINKEQLAFMALSPDAYMPLILAMILLNNRYTGFETKDLPIKYLDSMFSVNLALETPGTTALVVPDNSKLAVINRELTLDINTDVVISGAYAARVSDKSRHYTETGSFPIEPSIFVKLYGDGWKLQPENLLEANQHLKMLPGPGDDPEDLDTTPNCEFVGTDKRMEVIAYMNARKQLAEYIRDRMFEEYVNFGGREAVSEWWNKLIQDNKDMLMRLCVEKKSAVDSGAEKNTGSAEWINSNKTPLRFLDFSHETKGRIESYGWFYKERYPFNKPHGIDRYGREDGQYLCPITGNIASIFFMFRFANWKELEACFGADNIPKLIKGWQTQRTGYGNHLLDATDAVADIGTVFEEYEIRQNKRLWTRRDWEKYFNRNWKRREAEVPADCLLKSSMFEFRFAIGFSKRGLNQLVKQVLAEEEAQKAAENKGQD